MHKELSAFNYAAAHGGILWVSPCAGIRWHIFACPAGLGLHTFGLLDDFSEVANGVYKKLKEYG
ncbi:MAG: hypothetical protein ACP5LX_00555, partial [Nitrososphaeria archaeon]